jgi:hypothetical protein
MHLTAMRLTAMRWTATAQFTVAAGMLAPVPGSAQLEIAPQIGLYIPRGPLIKQGSPSNPNGQFEKRPEGSIFLGVRALFWATKRLGVAASVSFAPSPVAVTDSFGTTDQQGAVLLSHSQLLVLLTSDRAPWFVHLGLGAGVISRSGGQWRYASGATAPAFLASLALGTRLYGLGVVMKPPYPPQRVPVLRVEVADYISRAQFDQGLPTQTTALTHHDFTGSIMVCFPVAR